MAPWMSSMWLKIHKFSTICIQIVENSLKSIKPFVVHWTYIQKNEIEDISFYVVREMCFQTLSLIQTWESLKLFGERGDRDMKTYLKELISGVMLLDDFLHYQAKTTTTLWAWSSSVQKVPISLVRMAKNTSTLLLVSPPVVLDIDILRIRAIKKQLKRYLHVMVYGEYAQQPAVEL